VNRLITSLGNAIYFPFLAPVVILGAIWLAWQGLIRKRATRTIEGTIWMVIACAAAIWLIGRPADFTGLGKTVSNGITQTLNVAFSGLPAPAASNCVPVQGHDPQVNTANYNFTGGTGIVDQNANELWTVLVCKPWLDGEFGTTVYTTAKGAKPTVVNQYGRQLLWSQAIATNENPTASLIQAKQDAYAGIAQSIKQNDPDVYSLFQGNQYPTRLEIAFAALFAALVAGVLVLLIAITLIILKLGFLLLLVAGPFFLIVGTHPGFGRVVALRWVEMLVGVLLKQAAVALVLSVLLYAYSLIMGTSDAVLPWALKILMIALVTVAVFIYRKPFVHLFSAVGYGMVGSRDRAEAGLAQAGSLARRNTVDAATVGVPGFAAYRAARWARRNPGQAAGLAATAATAGAAGAAAGAAGAASAATVGSENGGPEQAGAPGDASADEAQAGAGRGGLASRSRGRAAAAADGSPGAAPPLDLPDRDGSGQQQRSPSGWARSGAADAAAGRARPDAAPSPRVAAPGDAGPSANAPGPRASGPRSSGTRAPGGAAPASAPPPSSAPARPGAARQRWPGVAPRPPAAAPPPSGGSAGPAPGAAPSTFGGAPSRRGSPSRSAPARGADQGSSTPRSNGSGGSGFWGSPSRGRDSSASPSRGPSRNAAPPLRSRDSGSGGGSGNGSAGRPGGAGRSAPPAAPSQFGGGQAGGGQSGSGAEAGPPGPFWLRPVRRKK
jgi:hypothetical protein